MGVLLFVFMNVHFLCGQQVHINKIDLPKQVPNNYINDIVKDKSGLLWLATNEGLIRFGSNTHVDLFSSDNNEVFKSNNIKKLFVDSDSILWLGTRQGGLIQFDSKIGEWNNYLNTSESNSISDNEVLSILEDSQGQFWVGTENGLNLFDKSTRTFYRFEKFAESAILNIYEDAYGYIWISTWDGGVFITSSHSTNIRKAAFKNIKIANKQNLPESIWKIFQDRDNRYWFGSHYSGVHYTELSASNIEDLKDGDFLPIINNFLNVNDDLTSLSTNIFIANISDDEMGNLWFGTPFGVCRISNEELKKIDIGQVDQIEFNRYHTDPFAINTIPSDVIQSLYLDDQGILWIGTDNGFSNLKASEQHKSYFDLKPNDSNFFVSTNIFVTKDNMVIVGYMESGSDEITLGVFDTEYGTIRPLKEELDFVDNVFDLLLLEPLGDDKLLIVRNSGLALIDFAAQTYEEIVLPKDAGETLEGNLIKSVLLDSNGNIWLGHDRTLVLVKEGGQVQKFVEGDSFLTDLAITDIVEDKYGNVWVSTFHGLNQIFETDTGFVCQHYLKDNSDPNSIPSNRLTSMVYSHDRLYLTSPSELISYDLDSERFSKLNVGNKKTLLYLHKGKDGIIWANSKDEIIYCDPSNDDYFTLRQPFSNIRERSISSDENSNLWFSEEGGITKLHNSILSEVSQSPKVIIPQATIFDSKGQRSESLHQSRELVLSHDTYRVELSFASNNFIDSEYNMFAYRLNGFEDEWVYTNHVKPIVYTNLENGKYNFQMKTANDAGNWSESIEAINLHVKAAVWQTSWFKILAALMIVGLVYLLFVIYNYRVVSANESLKEEIDKRIETENKLKLVNEQLTESNKELERFAFLASHDLKEPLRTIGAYSGLLKQKYTSKIDEKGRDYFSHIEEGVKRMYRLIDSLLNYSSNKEADLEIVEIDLNELISDVLKDLDEIIKNQNVIVELQPLVKIYGDEAQLGMLFSNLIKNGIKFNESASKLIHVSLEKLTESYVTIAVKDNGIGISKSNYDEIFTIFKRLNNKSKYEGSGIGLALCRKIVERHNGKLTLNSKVNDGTSFYVTLPVESKGQDQ